MKASYERIIHPPPGVVSARQVDYAAISRIDTPDPRTVVFHLKWPEAAMLASFASPWNCIYSAAKLAAGPEFPENQHPGNRALRFCRARQGQVLVRDAAGRNIFARGSLISTATRPISWPRRAVMKAYESGSILAEFRGVSPTQRDELIEIMKDRVTVSESPWLSNLMVVFNTKRAPFNDARVRRALSLAIDRWGAAERQGTTTFLKYVGGLMRPGSAWATPEGELATLPGFSRDIDGGPRRGAAAAGGSRRVRSETRPSGARHPDAAFRGGRSAGGELAGGRRHDDAAAAQHLGMAEDRRSRRFRRGARFRRAISMTIRRYSSPNTCPTIFRR